MKHSTYLIFLCAFTILIYSCGADSIEPEKEVLSCYETGALPRHVNRSSDSIRIISGLLDEETFYVTVETNDRTNDIGFKDHIRVFIDVNQDFYKDDGDLVIVSPNAFFSEPCLGTEFDVNSTYTCEPFGQGVNVVSTFESGLAPFDYPHVSHTAEIHLDSLVKDCAINYSVELMKDFQLTYYPKTLNPPQGIQHILFEGVYLLEMDK